MIVHNQNAPSTIIHRLHPFSKMAVGAGFSGLALCLKSPLALSVLIGFILVVLAVARVRLSRRQWLTISLFLTIISTLNFLASQDTMHAATYSMRFAVFLTAMPILAATTDPQQMTQALSRTPLPGGVAMALLLVWRFFPLMAEEARQMRQAALLRGCAADGFVARIYRGLLIPLAFCVIEYTDRITLALELRGFTPTERRTCHQPFEAGIRDIGFSLAALCAVGFSAWLQWGDI
jgi:energy-coupling factor transport system permease protein